MRSFNKFLNGLAAAGLALLTASPAAETLGQTTRRTQRRAGSRARATAPAANTQQNPAVFIGGGASTGAARQTTPRGNNGVMSGAALGAGVGGVRQPSEPVAGANTSATPSAGGADIGPKKRSDAIGAGGAGTYARGPANQPPTVRRRRGRRGSR